MAEIVTEFEFKDGRQGGNYPLDQWADGHIWRAVRGVDFQSKEHSFRMGLYKAASRLNKKVQTSLSEPGVVVFRFYDDEE